MEKIIKDPDEYNKIRIGNYYITYRRFILLVSLILSSIIAIFGFVFQLYLTYLTLSALIISIFLIGVIPYTFYRALEDKTLREIYERYPKFLRDLSESLSSGMTILQAFKHLSNVDYGSLTPFIKKLYTWLSWGMDLKKAFMEFNKYFEDIPDIKRANYVILQAYISGGDLSSVLNRIAEDLEAMTDLNKLKVVYVSQQILVLYVVYFIFIGLLISIKSVIEPMAAQQMMVSSNQGNLGLFSGNVDIAWIKFISMLAIVIEAISISLISGVVETGYLRSSFKHLGITMLIGVISIVIFFLPSSILVDMYVYPSIAYPGQTVKIKIFGSIDSIPLNNKNGILTITGVDENGNSFLFLNETQTFYNGLIEREVTFSYPGNYTIVFMFSDQGRVVKAIKKVEVK